MKFNDVNLALKRHTSRREMLLYCTG